MGCHFKTDRFQVCPSRHGNCVTADLSSLIQTESETFHFLYLTSAEGFVQTASSEVFFNYRVVHPVHRGSLPLLSCWHLAALFPLPRSVTCFNQLYRWRAEWTLTRRRRRRRRVRSFDRSDRSVLRSADVSQRLLCSLWGHCGVCLCDLWPLTSVCLAVLLMQKKGLKLQTGSVLSSLCSGSDCKTYTV